MNRIIKSMQIMLFLDSTFKVGKDEEPISKDVIGYIRITLNVSASLAQYSRI